ncbi:Holliday junction branch migration protein RuvA [Catalinimonas niigatensis]|uniref:Holliday junction branch migration protein RuvA n=1 Tax=Catalinimonas niigatensis TaxID=1397264 RepID=UPI002665DC22|nr:Holliday junction branch migration protein RuvA [Catalinimonas niigatensis]WPP51616.1 Holliday junction branch migration protein RuvA [Catalinimonas niigatensis]
MFAYIEGNISYKDPTYVVLDVQGVGYEIRIPLSTFAALEGKSRFKLHTYLHVREDAHILFGFARTEEKRLFLDLLSISGVGPSLALMLLSSMQVEELKMAIAHGEVKMIQRVKGIGAKTAQRLVLELQDKVKKELLITSSTGQVSGMPMVGYNTIRSEALSALTTLGFGRAAAEKSIDKALSEWQKKHHNASAQDTEIRLEDLIKLALKTT